MDDWTSLRAKGYGPRRWQQEAYDTARDRWAAGDDWGVIRAVMGSGKSIVIAEIAATTDGPILISAPRRRLVQQIAATVRERVGASRTVGVVSSDARETGADIVVSTYERITLARVAQAMPEPAVWICDECHRVARSSGVEANSDGVIRPARAVGFSATPYRADHEEGIPLWRDEWYSYGWREAMDDGVIVPYEIRAPETDAEDIVSACAAWLDAVDGHGVLSAESIAEADGLASELGERGYRVASIHSRLGKDEQAARIESLRVGDLCALVHVDLLTEGVDLPWLRWIGLTRERGSRVSYAQEIGRVLRAHPGKDRAIVWDPHGMTTIHDLGGPAALGDAIDEDAEPEPPPKRITMMIDEATSQIVGIYGEMELRIAPERCPLPCTYEREDDGTVTVRVESGGIFGAEEVTGGVAYVDSPDGMIWLRHPVIVYAEEREIDRVLVPQSSAETRALNRYNQARIQGLIPSLGTFLRERAGEQIETAGGLRRYLSQYTTPEQRRWIRTACKRLTDHYGDAMPDRIASLVTDALEIARRSKKGAAVQAMVLLRHEMEVMR